jgi:hypothetical protein
MHVEVAPSGIVQTPKIIGEGTRINRETSVRSKILSHFIKGKISFSPMETILMIPRELEHLESLVKLAKHKKKLINNRQPSIYGFNISNDQKDLYQQNALEQDYPFACRNKQLCG